MMNTLTNTSFGRAATVGVLGLAGLALLAGGCKTSAPRRASAPGVELQGLSAGNQGAASDVVFASPGVQSYYIAIKPEVLEELRRRDRELAIYDPAPVSALERQWPQGPRPSLANDRITRSQTFGDRTFIYYELEGDDRRWDR